MTAFLAGSTAGQWNAARAMASSHIVAARLHLRAGRLRPSLWHLKKALAYDATIIIQPRFWRLISGGIFGQLRYRLLAVTRRADDKIA
jgi:hypothetical protein